MNCPNCQEPMTNMLVHSNGVVAIPLDYFDKIRSTEGGGCAEVGLVHAIIPKYPHEEKYARSLFCEKCHMVCFGPSDVIPSEEVPPLAK